MNKAKINNEVTHGNYGLEKVLKDMVQEISASSFGKIRYVIPSGNASPFQQGPDHHYTEFVKANQEKYPDGTYKVYTTLSAAVAAADEYDTIIVAPGLQTITETIEITKNGLRILGMLPTIYSQASTIKCATGTEDIFLIKANRVEIAYLSLSERVASKAIAIGDTAGQAYYQTYIHDCNFDAYSTALYGIAPGNADAANNDQVDTVNLVVENCIFNGFKTAAIVANGTRDAYINNTIWVPSSGVGIIADKHTDSRFYGIIRGNLIIGTGTTDTGIQVTDVGSAAGLYAIVDNTIQGCNTTITTQTNLQGGGNESLAAATGARTAIDIVT